MNNSSNIRLLLTDEISLEGLDGITLQTLWFRVSQTTKTKLPFPELLQKEYWNIICKIPDFSFYELPEPRPDFVQFDRFLYVDGEADITYYEPEEQPDDIYKHKTINDMLKGIKGSCPTYFTRKDITDEARTTEYCDAKKWGNKLVIVASQELREYALIGLQVSNCLELSPIQYCVLERIGRARYQGEITQGKRSLQVIGEDPKSLFYHRKTLLKYKLITKQVYYQKSGSQNFSGTLLHLQRFFSEKKSKQLILTEQIVDILRNKPNYRAQYSEITNQLNLVKSVKKLLKSGEFQRFVHTDVKVPYREYFPESENTKDWKQKSGDKEKMIRCLQLIDPDIDVSENWYKTDPEDDDDNESDYLNYGNLKYGIPLLAQAAEVVRSRGENGCCQSELGELMGVNKLCARSFCRNLVRRNVVTCVMNDVGRQRVTRFTSRRYENKGLMTLQLKHEREKMLNLMSVANANISISSGNSDQRENSEILDENSVYSNISSVNQEKANSVDNDSCMIDVTVTNDLTRDELQNIPNVTKENLAQECEQPPCKKIKLDKKRPLKDADEPNIKIIKIKPCETDAEKNLDNIDVKLIVTKSIPGLKGYSKGFAEQFKTEYLSNNKLDGSRFTYRILRRANFVIEAVREVKVIADMTKLIKMIQEDEKDEGYNVKIDKKSLLRLLLKLAKEGYVKYIKATLSCNNKVKSISFICEPNIDENHSIIQSAIEQAKMKFHLSGKFFEPKTDKIFQNDNIQYGYDRTSAKLYGFCPKFIRMRLIHELMFYLIYDEQNEPLTKPEEYKSWLDSMSLSYDDKLIAEMTPIYHKKEMNWKTFIPPTPIHIDWPNGWILICDVLLRMPLHIFVQCFSVVYQIDGIEYYLNHPVRKHFLVKHLPAKIRNALMFKRRYIFQMHEICTRLCYCGLLQFGPQKLKEKDQVFVYLNRRTSMLNTTTSQEGYHEISEKEYDKHLYYFEHSTDVEQYWYDLWTTCMTTLLGGRLCVNGKYIVLEQLDTKPAMIEAVQPKTPEDALQRDNGDVPGNHRGAAGLDSALFAHLRRSWNWNCNNDIGCGTNSPSPFTSGTVKVHNPYNITEIMEIGVKKFMVQGPTKNLNKVIKNSAIKIDNTTKKYKISRKTVIRKVGPIKNSKIRKPFYDEIDKIALQKMGKLRTDWSPLEDHILLLCTIGSKYLCPNRHKQIISFTVIRDVLHKLVENSSSKTSRACQRRILYIMKNNNTKHSVQMCLEEIYQCESITKKYKHICKRILNSHVSETEMNIAFIELVAHMSTMFSKLIEPGKKIQIPSTIQKFNEKFRICGGYRKTVNSYKEPETVTDITLSIIRTVIHSSMCCSKDKTSWAYQLFKIYQQYPETLLRSVITKTRNEQMIALKKSYMRAHKTKSSSMPLSSSPYQLSITYKHQLHTKFPYSIYEEAYNILSQAAVWLNHVDKNIFKGIEVLNPSSGTAVALMELTNKINISYKFEIPDDIIVLDQTLQKDKYYERIIKKYYNFIEDPSSAELEEKKQSSTLEEEENFPDFDLNLVKKNESPFSIKTASSRIAFYMMRAEMCEGIDEKSTQHMHDFFVVNSCKVFINFFDVIKKEHYEPEDLHEDYLIIKNEIGPKILAEIKNNAIIPDECPATEKIIKDLYDFNANDADIAFMQKIIDYTLECNSFGASNKEIMVLKPQIYEGNLCTENLLEMLINCKIILQTGVEKIRYVHFQHKKPWIVNSHKILRLDREKISPVLSTDKDEMNDKLFRKKTNFSMLELQKSKQRLDLKTQQKVKVMMSPWIRIDGTLNRRVLDRWLGTILIACLQHPGISLEKLNRTFTYLRPVELANLIKYLINLKCIRQIMVKRTKASLFSSIPTITTDYATGLEDPKDILIEPFYDATNKYAIFIGKKTYASDFLST